MFKFKKIILILPLVIIFILIITIPYKFFISLRSNLYPKTLPLLKTTHRSWLEITNMSNFFYNHDTYNLLKKQVDRLQEKIIQFEELKYENERLKNLLDFKAKTQNSYIACEVVGRDPTEWFGALLINKGKTDGIIPNMAVVRPEGVVGRVVEIAKTSSKVLLITDANCRIAGTVQRSRQTGIIEGVGGGLCLFKYLPCDADIIKGDLVVTSAISRIFPEGLLLGKVTDIRTSADKLYKTAIVKPAVEFSTLEEVLCVGVK